MCIILLEGCLYWGKFADSGSGQLIDAPSADVTVSDYVAARPADGRATWRRPRAADAEPGPCVTITGSEDAAARPADGRATWRRTRSDAARLSRRVGRPARHLRHQRPRNSGGDVGAIRPSLSLAPRRRGGAAAPPRGQRTARKR